MPNQIIEIQEMPMNLDDHAAFGAVDTQAVIQQVNTMPDQLLAAWEQGQTLVLERAPTVQHVLLAGVGKSATSAGLAAAYAERFGRLPVLAHCGYHLPAWARGPQSLVIGISHSGDAEETAAVLEQAAEAGCRTLAISGPGPLAEQARRLGLAIWPLAAGAEIASSLGFLLAALYRLGCIDDPSEDVFEALHALRSQQTRLQPETPVRSNLAKRIAGQLMDRWVTIFASEAMAAVAKHWSDQLNIVAKAWGQFALLPEADHTLLAGLNHPEASLSRMMALFLTAESNDPRNAQRLDLTRRALMVQGINTDFLPATGERFLAHLLTLVQFADYTTYYLAMIYREDPAQPQIFVDLKQYLREQRDTD